MSKPPDNPQNAPATPTGGDQSLSRAPLSDQELERSIARLKPSHRKWLDCFLRDPGRDATAATVAAGFGGSRAGQNSIGSRLKRKYSQIIAAYDTRLAEASLLSPREVQEQLASIARDTKQETRDRLKALELIAKIHGMLSDKQPLSVEINIGAVLGASQSLRDALIVQAEPVKVLAPGKE
jgi:phage-related tail protein